MYRLSERHALETRKEQDETIVVILNVNTGNYIEIPAVRWASFLLLQADIDEAIKKLKEKKDYVKYFTHFGGGWYVSVTTGFSCVDIRRFYRNVKAEIKPTKQGLTLRLSEWTELMNLLPLIMSFEPELLVACPCSMREDHLGDPNVVLNCRECSPFGDVAWDFRRGSQCTFRRLGARKTIETLAKDRGFISPLTDIAFRDELKNLILNLDIYFLMTIVLMLCRGLNYYRWTECLL